MIYGYCRCSTDKQTVDNQKFEIEQFARREKIFIDVWVSETISSTQDLKKRKLNRLLKKMHKNDILIASELSRLGRNLLQVMGILSECLNKECQVWTIKDNYRLGADISSKVLAFAFSLSAEIERTLIAQRTKEALSRLKAEGRKLGRPVGVRNKRLKLSGKKEDIIHLLERGISKTEIAKTFKVDRSTLYYFLKRHFEDLY